MTDRSPSNLRPASAEQAASAAAEASAALAVERAAFGARLKGMREARGVTLPSLAQSTRINPHFLLALESGAFERLPGEVFGRGFVRCIAKTFSEDQDVWVAEYDRISVRPVVSKTAGCLEVDYKSKPVANRGSALKSNLATISSLMRRGLGMRLIAAFLALIGVGIGVTKLLDGRIRRGSIYGDVRDAATGAARAFRPQDVTGPTPAKTPAPDVTAAAPVVETAAAPVPASPEATAPATVAATPEVVAAPSAEVAAATPPAPVEAAALAPAPVAEAAPTAAAASAPAEAPAPVTPPPAPVLAAAPQPEPVPAAAPAPAPAVAQAEAAAPAAAPATPATPGGQVLELMVTEPVRVRMDVDAGESVVKELVPDTYRFTFTDKADMLIYDAGAVKISFNGRPLGSLGSKGRVRRISFQAAAPEAKKL